MQGVVTGIMRSSYRRTLTPVNSVNQGRLERGIRARREGVKK